MCVADPLASVRDALDRAIADVAAAEYGRLADGLSPDAEAKEVNDALQSLLLLKQGTPPDYDSDWIAPFYVTWYQPRQINLAYAAVREHISADDPPQCVVGYGSGAWAMQFALAIALAEKQCVGAIVHRLDPSDPLTHLGAKLWSKFNEILCEQYPNDDFAQCLAINLEFIAEFSRTHTCLADAVPYLSVPMADCWFTAVHAIYEKNSTDLRDVLRTAEDDNAPAFALATFDGYSDRKPSFNRTAFFQELGFEHTTLATTWRGDCPATTKWRHGLAERLPHFSSNHLLKRSVTWGGRLATGQDVAMTRRRTQ
ncbi:MAG: hypothetical protein F4X12_14620 [Acidobacteriia bacterium]|nr:hypothetical protein [Terriglobia bacterium]